MFGAKHLNFERALNRCGHTAHYKEMTETAETAHKKSLASRLATQKMCSKSPIYSYWLLAEVHKPFNSLCLSFSVARDENSDRQQQNSGRDTK